MVLSLLLVVPATAAAVTGSDVVAGPDARADGDDGTTSDCARDDENRSTAVAPSDGRGDPNRTASERESTPPPEERTQSLDEDVHRRLRSDLLLIQGFSAASALFALGGLVAALAAYRGTD